MFYKDDYLYGMLYIFVNNHLNAFIQSFSVANKCSPSVLVFASFIYFCIVLFVHVFLNRLVWCSTPSPANAFNFSLFILCLLKTMWHHVSIIAYIFDVILYTVYERRITVETVSVYINICAENIFLHVNNDSTSSLNSFWVQQCENFNDIILPGWKWEM